MLIDRQYKLTRKVIFSLLVTYLIGFALPMILNVYNREDMAWGKNHLFDRTFRGIAVSTQVFFLFIEWQEYKYEGSVSYFTSFWNFFDFI